MDLSRRTLSVLREVVELYIRRGQPVASGQVARSPQLALSAATIRSIMAGLEAAGLLTRAHQSAGCVPSDRSFRVYVDSLRPRGRSLPATARKQLMERVAVMRRELVEDLQWVAELTADATREAGVAVRPMGDEPELEAVSLVPLREDRVLGVLVTSDGTVEKRLINLRCEPSRSDLQAVANYLTRRFQGATLVAVRDHLLDRDRDSLEGPGGSPLEGRTWVRDLAEQLFVPGDDVEMLVAGAERLLQSEDFAEVGRMRSLVEVLSDRGSLVREWRRGFDRCNTQIIIGRESAVTASGGLGMVATLFFREGRRVGAVGVVGPRRMDYGHVVPVVEFIGDTLTKIMDEPGATYA